MALAHEPSDGIERERIAAEINRALDDQGYPIPVLPMWWYVATDEDLDGRTVPQAWHDGDREAAMGVLKKWLERSRTGAEGLDQAEHKEFLKQRISDLLNH